MHVCVLVFVCMCVCVFCLYSLLCCQLPFNIVLAFVYVTIVYWMVGELTELKLDVFWEALADSSVL